MPDECEHMPDNSQPMHRTTLDRLLSPAVVVPTGALVWLLLFLTIALKPGWRGGYFITWVLAATVALMVSVLVQEVRQVLRPEDAGHDIPEGDRLAQLLAETATPLEWSHVRHAVTVTLTCFGLTLVFGLSLGATLFLLWILRRHSQTSWRFAVVFALVMGVALPYSFAMLLGIQWWTGMIPTIIPWWLGGGLLPPI